MKLQFTWLTSTLRAVWSKMSKCQQQGYNSCMCFEQKNFDFVIIALPPSVVSQVGTFYNRSWFFNYIEWLIPAHMAMSVGPRGGAGKGQTVYPVPLDMNQREEGVYPSGQRWWWECGFVYVFLCVWVELSLVINLCFCIFGLFLHFCFFFCESIWQSERSSGQVDEEHIWEMHTHGKLCK